MPAHSLTDEQIRHFRHHGYLILEDLIDRQDVDSILAVWRQDARLAEDVKENANFEGEGLKTRLAYRGGLSDDAYSALARSRRIVGPMERIYGGPISHYYSLNMQKDPNTGGWEYHQDYGYHYNEFFYPDFVSVMVALDPATRDNGCLRVVKGSNRLGRLEHEGMGSQRIADRGRVELALEQMEEVHCEMTPGSVLYFDGNILHASNPNTSDQGRWSMVIAYVPSSNLWVRPAPSQMTAFEPLDDDAFRVALRAHAEGVGL
jgi:ectoine hydroxylase-related dioxygenase (phytanoyl-CoA dioxygenase family)